MEEYKKLDKLKGFGIIDNPTVIKLRANLATNKLSAIIAINIIYKLAQKLTRIEKELTELKNHFKNQKEAETENETK